MQSNSFLGIFRFLKASPFVGRGSFHGKYGLMFTLVGVINLKWRKLYNFFAVIISAIRRQSAVTFQL